ACAPPCAHRSPRSQPRHQAGHLERALHRRAPLVAGGRRGALERLLDRVHGEHPEGDRHAGLEARELKAPRAFAGDVLEVRGVASSPTYPSISRPKAEMPCICFGADSTRMRRTPRSLRIWAPTPKVRSTAPSPLSARAASGAAAAANERSVSVSSRAESCWRS